MNEPATILLVDDTPANLNILVDALSDTGYNLTVATSGEQAIRRCRQSETPPDLILLDVLMPGIDGFETCRRLKHDPHSANIPIIFMTALSESTDKVKGFRSGGVDYITKPIEHAEVLARIETHLAMRRLQSALAESNASLERRVEARTTELKEALAEIRALKDELEVENISLRAALEDHQPYGDIVGRSGAIGDLIEKIEMVAPTDANVLIQGESGTGKELVARELHKRSLRREGPIVKVNCACIPKELYESEFFGHVRGAFTGAVSSRLGRFAAAHGGTLFLDEVGEIPLELQSKLLRVIQEGTYERVGEERTRKADVRIIAATNRELAGEVDEGRFRADLYYRLNVFPILVPSLRERRDDVVLLASYFIERASRKLGLGKAPALSEPAIEALESYHWPGNIRELENTIEQALIRARFTGRLTFESLGATGSSTSRRPPLSASPARVLTEAQMRDLERSNVERALEQAKGRIRGEGGAADLLGLKPTTLASRLKRMGLKPS